MMKEKYNIKKQLEDKEREIKMKMIAQNKAKKR